MYEVEDLLASLIQDIQGNEIPNSKAQRWRRRRTSNSDSGGLSLEDLRCSTSEKFDTRNGTNNDEQVEHDMTRGLLIGEGDYGLQQC